MLVCGDRRADKARAAASSSCIPGLRCVDAGRLEMARIAESLTALLIGDQRPLQDARRDPDHRALTRPAVVVLLAGGTGGAKLARGLLDVAATTSS